MSSTASEASVASSVTIKASVAGSVTVKASGAGSITVKTSGASSVLVHATVEASFLSLNVVVKTADTRVCLTVVRFGTNVAAYTGAGSTSMVTSAGSVGSASMMTSASGAAVVTRHSLFGLETKLLESSRELIVVLARWAVILFVCTMLTTSENTTSRLEFVKGLHGQSRQAMVLGGCVMSFVDGNCGVDDFWLNSLFLDDRNNSLVDVMMDMLASHSGSGGLCMMGLFDPFVVLEVSHLTCESLLSILLVVMVELSFLGR